MMKNIQFKSGAAGFAKAHVCAASLVDEILHDLQGRGFTVDKVTDADSAFVDLPGMCFVNRPTDTVKADAVKLAFPSSEVGYWANKLDEYSVRGESRKYIKIHTHYACVCVTPRQRDRLVSALRRIQPTAERKSEAFLNALR